MRTLCVTNLFVKTDNSFLRLVLVGFALDNAMMLNIFWCLVRVGVPNLVQPQFILEYSK